MTTPEDVDTKEPGSTPEVSPRYIIDPSRAKELDRSLPAMLLGRRCSSCKARLEVKPGLPSEKEQIREIVKCCAKEEGFIRPDMPMQEIAFRSLLAKGNKAETLEQLHYLVTDRWCTPSNPRNITVDGLRRVLDSDEYYGFKDVSST